MLSTGCVSEDDGEQTSAETGTSSEASEEASSGESGTIESGGDGDDGSETGSTGDGDGDGDGTGEADCPDDPLAPGLHPMTIEHDGMQRVYDIYIPASHDGSVATPIVFNLHPLVLGGALHGIWTSESGMNDKAEEEGFIVIQPDGTGEPASWNGGDACCDPAASEGMDDVGLLKAIATEIESMVCVDRKRIYSVGMSNGGYLSHRVGCEESAWIAAIGPVASSLSPELECDLQRAVPMMQISGSEDNLPTKEVSFQAWAELNGCTDIAEETYNNGTATCVTHDDCDDGVEVTHCVVEGGGHCWFSDISPQLTPGCSAQTDLITPDILWDFLSQYSLP
jgi:polyhydroxybutyrate depolymerase